MQAAPTSIAPARCAPARAPRGRGVRRELIGCERGHQHEVELGGVDPRLLERGPAGLGRQRVEALARAHVPPLVHPGPVHYPLLQSSGAFGNHVVADHLVGHRHGERCDRSLAQPALEAALEPGRRGLHEVGAGHV